MRRAVSFVVLAVSAIVWMPGVGASTGPLLPDIVEEVPKHLGIHNAHQREVLRFSTTHWNFGDGNLQIRGGGQVAPCEIEGVGYEQCTHAVQELLDGDGDVVGTHPAGVAVFHPEHNHWHQSSVAAFAVRATLDGPPVRDDVANKTTFCLVDVERSSTVSRGADRTYWDCTADVQGISVGWGDEYHHSTPGQSLDITGLPAGDYYLTQDGDPDDHWLETDDSNNRSWVRFRLNRKGANPEVTVLETFGYAGNRANP